MGEEVQVQRPCVWEALGVLEEEKAGPRGSQLHRGRWTHMELKGQAGARNTRSRGL